MSHEWKCHVEGFIALLIGIGSVFATTLAAQERILLQLTAPQRSVAFGSAVPLEVEFKNRSPHIAFVSTTEGPWFEERGSGAFLVGLSMFFTELAGRPVRVARVAPGKSFTWRVQLRSPIRECGFDIHRCISVEGERWIAGRVRFRACVYYSLSESFEGCAVWSQYVKLKKVVHSNPAVVVVSPPKEGTEVSKEVIRGFAGESCPRRPPRRAEDPVELIRAEVSEDLTLPGVRLSGPSLLEAPE
ncbi:MAG: hypothetical protein HY816_11380 [Candidatus Wallbacteria bacterium]|nr:hypothetical protein [Candidatus Wallbacteria bacterium]